METQKQKTKINWKSVLVGVIIGAIIVGLIGLAFWYFTRPKASENSSPSNTKNSTSSAKITTPSAKTSTPTVTFNENTGWKTYRNDKFGFSIKYPSTWEKDQDADGTLGDDGLRYLTFRVSKEKGTTDTDSVGVFVAYQGDFCYSTKTPNKESITILGISGEKTTCYNSNSQTPSQIAIQFKYKGENWLILENIKTDQTTVENIVKGFSLF